MNMSPKEYTDQEITELSKKNPGQVFEGDNGKIVFNGMIFKNKEEFEISMKIMLSPAFKRFISIREKLRSFFKFNKKTNQ